MFQKIFIIFLIFFTSLEAKSEIVINNWDQDTTITESGRKVEVKIRATAQNLPPNNFHSGFAISFSQDQNITIKNVSFNNHNANYSFNNNQLSVEFDEGKINNETFTVGYLYLQKDNKIDKYLRQEFIKVPEWIKGARARITMNIPNNFQVISLNKNIRKIGSRLIYQEIVPESGFLELIKLTPKSTIWDVKITKSIKSKTNLIDLEVKIPVYFDNGGQKIKDNHTISTPNPISGLRSNEFYILKYENIQNNKVDIVVNSTVYGEEIDQQLIKRNPSNYLQVNQSDWLLLGKILSQIKNDPNLKSLPIYAKIGDFVHNYIKYDRDYIGRLLDNASILSLKKGVCAEYAQLYNSLARMAGIPAVIVNGIAQGEYGKFEGHSWNMIYLDNKWQQVDPTWNLMSGAVSSSHIYFYDNATQSIQANWRAKSETPSDNVSLKTEFTAQEIIVKRR